MITFTQGNLLESKADALVNTVNTVGVMGKGIALMFKEAFPENFAKYVAACERKEVSLGQMFVTERRDMFGPRWIINFPTKANWRFPSQIEWIDAGLEDLCRVIAENSICSVAIPPLGAGNGGLDWNDVKLRIVAALANVPGLDVTVYEPVAKYQNVAKKQGVDKFTPARALIAELVRRYWILGIECTILEVQKLAYFLEKQIVARKLKNMLNLRFQPNRFGPYSQGLGHLLNSLDGSYLHCDKRLPDAGPTDIIWFDDAKRERLEAYLKSAEVKPYLEALNSTEAVIDGFQSPLGMELLATVDWLLDCNEVNPNASSIREGLRLWPAGAGAGERKLRLFDDRLVGLALQRLAPKLEDTAA
jgi:O-acetyl-ADP-ribose deacetylase (regulator of RNase III)